MKTDWTKLDPGWKRFTDYDDWRPWNQCAGCTRFDGHHQGCGILLPLDIPTEILQDRKACPFYQEKPRHGYLSLFESQ